MHKPTPTRTLDPDIVRMLLDSAETRFVTVTFYSTQNEIKTRNGLLRATSRLVGNERGAAQSARMKESGQVWLAKPDGKSSSFFLDRVLSISAGGASYSVND